jgi:hypothetical protein
VGRERLAQDLLGQELAEFDHQGVDGPAAAMLHLQILIEGEEPAPADLGRARLGDLDHLRSQ